MGSDRCEDRLASASSAVEAVSPMDLIAESHERCQRFGLSSNDSPDFGTICHGEIRDALYANRKLSSHALPVMETLYEQIRNTHSMVILTDQKGLILQAFGDNDFLERADQVALKPGVEWSEQSKGTNAIGTALAVGAPTVVNADQHFLRANHFLTCSCVPIFDPVGTLIGALDVTGEQRSYHKHTMALVRMSAQMIENHLFSDTFTEAVRVHFHTRAEFIGTLVEGIAAFSPGGKLLSSNRSGQFQLGLSLQGLKSHTFSSLFGLSMSALIDRLRTSRPGIIRCYMHNGVAVYLRSEFSRPVLIAPSGRRGDESQPVAPNAAGAKCDVSLHQLETGDPQVGDAIARITKALGRDIPILIQGEIGTGKSMLAQAIHNDSPHRDAPFVVINCASAPEDTLEAELFGLPKGGQAGSSASGTPGRIVGADGGTLFLDEIGDLPLRLQARLLRVLQVQRVSVSGTDKLIPVKFALVCSTHRNLRRMIETQAFREDLFYRISALSVRLPLLRKRTDLPAVAPSILKYYDARSLSIDDEVIAIFRRYSWPGNLKEFTNLLRAAQLIVECGKVMHKNHLPHDFLDDVAASRLDVETLECDTDVAPNGSNALALGALKLQAIRDSLKAHHGNVSAVSRELGISRNTIYRSLAGRFAK